MEGSEVWKRRQEWSHTEDFIGGMAAYRDFPNAREDMLEGRFVKGYLLQFHAVKKVYAGAEVEQSADEGTGDERIFAIPEVIDDLLDEFRWDTKLMMID